MDIRNMCHSLEKRVACPTSLLMCSCNWNLENIFQLLHVIVVMRRINIIPNGECDAITSFKWRPWNDEEKNGEIVTRRSH